MSIINDTIIAYHFACFFSKRIGLPINNDITILGKWLIRNDVSILGYMILSNKIHLMYDIITNEKNNICNFQRRLLYSFLQKEQISQHFLCQSKYGYSSILGHRKLVR